MKKPTLEEVKEHFKNAKEVKSLFDGRIVNLEEVEITKDIHYWLSMFWIDYTEDGIIRNLKLWSEENGYAEIISYK